MTNIIKFIPKRELSASENLYKFISFAREELTLWRDLPGFHWESNIWPTTYTKIRFTNIKGNTLHPQIVPESAHFMSETFCEFSKAWIRYKHSIRPCKNVHLDMVALRSIEAALLTQMSVPDITKLTRSHYDISVDLFQKYIARQSICSNMLSMLKQLADFNIITSDAYFWKSPFVRAASYDSLYGVNAPTKVRARKESNQNALIAIADIFAKGATTKLTDSDTMITCITGLLLCAPMRINEILRLRVDCLKIDKDKNNDAQYYLTYWVQKTQQFTRKPVPATMAYVAKESIRRIREITENGRNLARHYENSPDKFYRHDNCPNVDDDQLLTPKQVIQALGYASLKSYGLIKKHTGKSSLTGFTLNSLWALICKEHKNINPHFPYQEFAAGTSQKPLKMSESLFCFCRFQLGKRAQTSPVLLAPFEGSYYSARLQASPKCTYPNFSFFASHGFEIIQLKSHGIRTLLNRMARKSGISMETLTTWSSRASIRQTRTYLYDDTKEFASLGASLLQTQQVQEPKSPVTESEAEILMQGPFHRSRYGICRRSWRTGPCNKFADCLNCSDLLMCKGDKLAIKSIRQEYDYISATYEAAKTAFQTGERPASLWVEKSHQQLLRLQQLLTILTDPLIEDGSPIVNAGTDFSHEQSIINQLSEKTEMHIDLKQVHGLIYNDEIIACMALLRGDNDA